MNAKAIPLLELMKTAFQFYIPIYQRNYSWDETQCEQLYKDIIQAGNHSEIKKHFIGSIVYIVKNQAIQSPVLVIDGQQRLTSCSLLLTALADFLKEHNLDLPDSSFPVKNIHNYYLTNPFETGENFYKLILSENDKHTLQSLVKSSPLPLNPSIRIQQNYTLFKNWINRDKENLLSICSGLAKLTAVVVALENGVDNPQLIFESMNSTGLALTQTDLIRNYILMGLEPQVQTHLYQDYWQKIEQLFGQETYSRYFNDFMRHYLTVKNGIIPNINAVYDEFKLYNLKNFQNNPEGLVKDIYLYANYYSHLVLHTEQNKELSEIFKRIKTLKVDVAYPLLLQLYHSYNNNKISQSEMLESVLLIESYVFRRAICSMPTNSLNKTFVYLGKDLDEEHILEHLKYRLLSLQTYRSFPNDTEFKINMIKRDVYNFPRRNYLLENLENYGRKEHISSANYTIEHVMPQNLSLSKEWQNELGENWQDIQKIYLHTIGNLTLTSYNSELSDKPYIYKRKEAKDKQANPIGLANSPLFLNHYFIQAEQWNKNEIEKRAELLAERAIKVWAYPILDNVVFEKYQNKENQQSQLNQYKTSDEIKSIFMVLSQEIQHLDEDIIEEFTKLYVGYSAKKRFVDVIIQAKSLKVVLNMPFIYIEDPLNRCEDITNIGSWGNGDIRVTLTSLDDIPYVIQLIRQSLEWNNQE